MNPLLNQLGSTRETLDRISPSFCLAKWLQVTLHLQNGHNHSCHHPHTHQAPEAELLENPSALHNSPYKKKLRKEMLDGTRPSECSYCWKVEDSPASPFSDRHIKSNDSWARPYLGNVLRAGHTKNIAPKYLEVSFSNLCNFKCAYCLPQISSSWMTEIKKFGPYPTKSNHHAAPENSLIPLDPRKPNPFKTAFWKWWPELYPELDTLRITGGEPLLSPDTFKVLDKVVEHKNVNLNLAVNSNLGVSDRLIERFISKLQDIKVGTCVKSLTVYTSLDCWGKEAEYIRFGLDIDRFQRNVDRLLRMVPEARFVVMCTFNYLSIPSFRGLLKYILELKKLFPSQFKDGHDRITLDTSYLDNPYFLAPTMAYGKLLTIFENDIRFLNKHAATKAKSGFSSYEKTKIERIFHLIQTYDRSDAAFEQLKFRDFSLFFQEYDRRRGTRFLDIFPDYKNAWALGKIYSGSN